MTITTRTLRLMALVATVIRAGAAAASIQWSPLQEPGVGGAVTSLAVDPRDSRRVLVGGDMLGIGRSTDGGKMWTQADANAGLKTCEIAEFTFDPRDAEAIWVGTMDGPYKSRDGGRTWDLKRTGMPPDGQWGKFTAPVQKVLFDPSNARHLLAFGGNKRRFEDGRCFHYGAVWESLDGGEQWALRGRIDPGKTNHEANITGVAYTAGSSSRTLFAAVPDYGVMRSDDHGAHWRAVNLGLPDKAVTFLAVHPTDPGTVWVTTDKHGVYKSTDGGGHWRDSNGGMTPSGFYDSIAVSPSSPEVLYLNANGQAKTFRSTDGGAHWTQVLANGDNPYGMSLVTSCVTIDPSNADNVFIGTFVSLYHSTDGGRSWGDASAVRVNPASNTWRGTGYGGLVCKNFAWNPWDLSMSIAQAMDDGKLLVSRDNLRSWRVHHPGVAEYSGGTEVSFCRRGDGTVIYAALGMQVSWFTKDGIYRSDDNGASWTLTARPRDNKGALSVYAFPDDPDKVFAVFTDNLLYRSSDAGSNWTPVALLNPNGKAELSVANVTGDALTNHPSHVYAAARGGVYISRDGVAWSYLAKSPTAGFDWPWGYQRVKRDPTVPGGLLVINVNGLNGTDGVYRYDGKTWSGKLAGSYGNVGTGITDAAIDPANGKRILAVCNQQPFQDVSISSGVWQTLDGGLTWAQENLGLGMLRAQTVSFRPDGKQIVVGCNGGGFYVSDR